MSKQTSRQASKHERSANKQSNNQSSKRTNPANKQTTNASVKQDQPQNKQATSASAKQANPANKPLTRQAAKQTRRQQQQTLIQNARRRAARNKRILIISLVTAAVVLVAVVSFLAYSNAHKATAQNQNALPTEQVFDPAYPPVDGIYCDKLEQTAYHHHVHLTIYMNGQQVPFPAGMGIAVNQSTPTCYYWLHTHASDGIVHIEAPAQHTFTLQNFLDIWQSFASSNTQFTFPTQLSAPDGWTMYVNGKKVNGDFSKIDISSNQAWHELITLIYNSPNAKPDMPGSYSWQPGL